MTVSSTVSHVPQEPQPLPPPTIAPPPQLPLAQPPTELPQLEPQELAPQGLQLDAQGAEQQELTEPPKQPPACANADISAAAASVRT